LLLTPSAFAQTLAPGKYQITLADGGMALDADPAAMSLNDGPVRLWRNNGGGASQTWTVSAIGAAYTIVVSSTGQALDADGPTMHADGGKVHLWNLNRGKTQLWHITGTGSNTWAVILADGGKALDAGISSMYANGGLVHLWSKNLGKTQKWVFTPWTSAPPMGPSDLASAPQATPAEIAEFDNIWTNQNGVGILGGDALQPFYYHANKPNETVYKYKKLMNTAALPASFMAWVQRETKNRVVDWVASGFQDVLDGFGKLVDSIPYVGGDNTWKFVDSWYPVSERKVLVCGKVKSVEMCDQDYLHTKLTVDKDFNIDILPSNTFQQYRTNRWLASSEQKETIEGEVRLESIPNTNPPALRNPLPFQATVVPAGQWDTAKRDHRPSPDDVCIYGPWMADVLEVLVRAGVPGTDLSIPGTSMVLDKLNTNNEIHPINQMWFKKNNQLYLFAFGDGSGYFDKRVGTEIEASALNHPMRFYVAFTVPRKSPTMITPQSVLEYNITSAAVDATSSPVAGQAQTLQLTQNNAPRLRVTDISASRTHTISFDKIRARSDGSFHGYIVVETTPIVTQGGSINVFVRLPSADQTPPVFDGLAR
jgi:hypothetical protein